MVMGYWSVAILFWQLSIDHIVNVLKSYIKDVDLPRHAWDTPPFLLIVSPTPPVQSVDAYVRMYVRTYVRTLGQSRDNQTKSGWPYSMSMVNLLSFGCHLIDRTYVRTYVRVYRLYGWGRGDYQKDGRGVSGVSCQVHIFYIWHSQDGQLTAVKTG